MPVPSSEKRVHTHHGLYSITGAQRTVQTLTVPRSAWLLLRFVCGRRLVKGLDVHRDGGRPGRSRAHVGDEHVRALRVAGGKTPVGVERADEGGVTRVPVCSAQLRTHILERGAPTRPRPASRLCAPARVCGGDLHLRRHHQLHPEAAALRSGRGRGHINVRAAQGRHDFAIVLPQPSDDRVDEHRGVALPATRGREGVRLTLGLCSGIRTERRAPHLSRAT